MATEAYKLAIIQTKRDIALGILDGVARNPVYAAIIGVVVNGQLAKAGLMDPRTAGAFNAALITGTVLSTPIGDSAMSGLSSLAGFAARTGLLAGRGAKALGKAAVKKMSKRADAITDAIWREADDQHLMLHQ